MLCIFSRCGSTHQGGMTTNVHRPLITCQIPKPDRLICLVKPCHSYSKSLKVLIPFPGQMDRHRFLSARHCRSISPLTRARSSPAQGAPKLLSIPLDEFRADESSTEAVTVRQRCTKVSSVVWKQISTSPATSCGTAAAQLPLSSEAVQLVGPQPVHLEQRSARLHHAKALALPKSACNTGSA